MKVQLSAKMQKDGAGFSDGVGFSISRGQVKEVPKMTGRIKAALNSGVLIEVGGESPSPKDPKKDEGNKSEKK